MLGAGDGAITGHGGKPRSPGWHECNLYRPGVITGDVGVSPGGAVPFTNTGCTIAGTVHVNDMAAMNAR